MSTSYIKDTKWFMCCMKRCPAIREPNSGKQACVRGSFSTVTSFLPAFEQ